MYMWVAGPSLRCAIPECFSTVVSYIQYELLYKCPVYISYYLHFISIFSFFPVVCVLFVDSLHIYLCLIQTLTGAYTNQILIMWPLNNHLSLVAL